jgi:hypothetical protein
VLKVKTNPGGFERVRTQAQLLEITPGDMQGPIIRRLDAVHRKQETRIFATEGAEGGGGPWPRLSPEYAARKRAAAAGGRQEAKGKKGKARISFLREKGRPIANKILVWTGETRSRFTKTGAYHIARVIVRGTGEYIVQLGAASTIASYHQHGAGVLPVRDPIKKTTQQVAELQRAITEWYAKERLATAARFLRRFGGRLTGGPLGGAPSKAANPTS